MLLLLPNILVVVRDHDEGCGVDFQFIVSGLRLSLDDRHRLLYSTGTTTIHHPSWLDTVFAFDDITSYNELHFHYHDTSNSSDDSLNEVSSL